jgi:hypothetical protein
VPSLLSIDLAASVQSTSRPDVAQVRDSPAAPRLTEVAAHPDAGASAMNAMPASDGSDPVSQHGRDWTSLEQETDLTARSLLSRKNKRLEGSQARVRVLASKAGSGSGKADERYWRRAGTRLSQENMPISLAAQRCRGLHLGRPLSRDVARSQRHQGE